MLNHLRRLIPIVILLSLLPIRSAIPCTTVELSKTPSKVVAKSYDWHQGHGMVFLNQSGLDKTALSTNLLEKAAKWTSKYGSVTFNQFGREFPLGGMNEHGLVVEIMWLSSSKYPPMDRRETVNELQWIQYQLDNYKTVAEAVAAKDKIRVAKVHADVHYMMCDPSGDCATFEYIAGKMEVRNGTTLPVATLTNDTYDASLAHLKGFDGFGGRAPVPTDDSSLSRFVRASDKATRAGSDEVNQAFDILDSVGGTDYTKFHIVYQPTSRKVSFRTYDYHTVKLVDVSPTDFKCEKGKDKTLIYDMNQNDKGDIGAQFVPYTEAENRRMVELALKDIKGLPPGAVDTIVKYPVKQLCQ